MLGSACACHASIGWHDMHKPVKHCGMAGVLVVRWQCRHGFAFPDSTPDKLHTLEPVCIALLSTMSCCNTMPVQSPNRLFTSGGGGGGGGGVHASLFGMLLLCANVY